MRIAKLAKQIEKSADKKPIAIIKRPSLFSTGSTLLNLACSDRWTGAFLPGSMINIIGDSHTGKTFLAHSILAEASLNKEFKDYGFYYDNAEAAITEGIRNMFGNALVNKLKTPDKNGSSTTIQEWRKNVWRIIQKGKPFIYILDSLDSLDSKEAQKRLDNEAAGKEEKGSYRMEKPKILSEVLGTICRAMEKTSSLLIILSQTRDNINPMSFIPKVRSGGKALKFYASIEMWLAKYGTIKSNGTNKRAIGTIVRVKVTKTKLTGKVREVNFSIYPSYGIDDVASCIDFLIAEKYWKQNKLKYHARDLGLFTTHDKLIMKIEEDSLERELKKEVGWAWKEIESSLVLDRKPRYD